MNQETFQNIFLSAQMRSTHGARFIAVCKGAFHQFTPPPQQALAARAVNPSPIGIYGALFGGLALPPPAATIRLRKIRSHLQFRQYTRGLIGVIALVRNNFLKKYGRQRKITDVFNRVSQGIN